MHSKGGEASNMIRSFPPRCAYSEVEVLCRHTLLCCDVERGSVSDRRRAPAKPPGLFNRLPRRKCFSACHDRLLKCCAPCTGFSHEAHLSHSLFVLHVCCTLGGRVPTSIRASKSTWQTKRPSPAFAIPSSLSPFPHSSCVPYFFFSICERHPRCPSCLACPGISARCVWLWRPDRPMTNRAETALGTVP